MFGSNLLPTIAYNSCNPEETRQVQDLSSCDEREKDKKPDRFYCKEPNCSASFSKNSKLIIHIRKHKGERPFACTFEGCVKTYTNSSHLRRHTLSHSEEKKKVVCDVKDCGKTFHNEYNLKKHKYRLHNTSRLYPYSCSECKQGFSKKNQLRKHSYLHTGILPFTCETCNTGFSTQRECNRHKRTHTVYSCDCGKEFERWSDLLAHKKICSTLELKCKTCSKVFSSTQSLHYHKQVHMDKEDRDVFVCNIDNCERYYFYKKNLIVHKKTFHKHILKKIPCPIESCNKTFTRKQNLDQHVARIHTTKVVKERKVRKIRKDTGKYKRSCAARLTRLKLPPSVSSKISQNKKVDLDKLKSTLLLNCKSFNNKENQISDSKDIVPFSEDIIKKKFDNQLLIEDCLLGNNSENENSSNAKNEIPSKEVKLNDIILINLPNNNQITEDLKVEFIDNKLFIEIDDEIIDNQSSMQNLHENVGSKLVDKPDDDKNTDLNNLQKDPCALCKNKNFNNAAADLEYFIDTFDDIECIKPRLENFARTERDPKIIKIEVKENNNCYYFCSCSFK